jgi:hypothetical protein
VSRLSLWQAQRRRRVLAGQPGQFEPNEHSQPQPIKLRETGRPTGMPVPEGGLIRCCLPAGKRIASLSVHKHVDDLCATVPNLCVHSGNAGDSAAWSQSEQGLYLGEHQSRPVHTEKTGIIHMPRSKNDG